MSELGRLLTQARTGKQFSLADVETATRIPRRYLEALETGDYAAFHRGATGRGFLRNYAQFLGMDADQILALYMAESGDPGPETLRSDDGQGRPVDYRPLEVDLHHVPPHNWWPWAIALVAVAVIGAGGWSLLGRGFDLGQLNWDTLAALGPRPAVTATASPTATAWVIRVTPTPPAAPAPAAAVTAVVQTTPTSDLLPFPTPTVPPTITPTPRPTRTPEVTVTHVLANARIVQRSWLRIVADGEVIEEALLEPGVDRTWEATRTLTIRTGNAAGVDLTVNDQAYGILGAVGQVLDRTFVVEGNQVVEAADTGTPPPPATPSATPTATSTPAG